MKGIGDGRNMAVELIIFHDYFPLSLNLSEEGINAKWQRLRLFVALVNLRYLL